MSPIRPARSTRAQPVEADRRTNGSNALEALKKSLHGKKVNGKPKQSNNIPPFRTRRTAGAENVSSDAESHQEDDSDDAFGETDDPADTSAQPNARAPSRASSVLSQDTDNLKSALEPWAGFTNGDKAIDFDQASISDLDMHGSVSSDSDADDDLDVDDADDDHDDSAFNGSMREEIEIPDDDDDYGDVDNVSDNSEGSDEFEAEVEADWEHDDIDWNDDHVYRYDDRRSNGFLVDEAFLNADLENIWDDWQVQFLNFTEPTPSYPHIHNDVPMNNSPLVRRVDAMSMNGLERLATGQSDTSDSSTLSFDSDNADAESYTYDDDHAGDTTDDDLPDDSSIPSPPQTTPRISRSHRRSLSDSSSGSSTTPVKKTPTMGRINVDTSRPIICSVSNSEGKMVRRVIQPLFNRTNLVYVSDNRRQRNLDGSPRSSISSHTEIGYTESPLFHIITGRLFQEAHFGSNAPQVQSSPAPMPVRNSFLSGPSMMTMSSDPVEPGDMSTAPLPDIAQLIDFDAAYPGSGRIQARTADSIPAVDLGPAIEMDRSDSTFSPESPSTTKDTSSEFTTPKSRNDLTNSATVSPSRKRRLSDTFDQSLVTPDTKRKRSERLMKVSS